MFQTSTKIREVKASLLESGLVLTVTRKDAAYHSPGANGLRYTGEFLPPPRPFQGWD